MFFFYFNSPLAEILLQWKTSFHHVNNMASPGLRKPLALIRCQHPMCIGIDVSNEYFVGNHHWWQMCITIDSIDVFWLHEDVEALTLSW